MRWFAILVVAACSSHATKPHEEPGARVSTVVTPADAQNPARMVPKLDTACRGDGDCVITSDTLEDFAPETYACCPGCTDTAVSATSYKAFQAFCNASSQPCPPIGCKMPQMRAVCEAGHCVAKDARPPPSPP